MRRIPPGLLRARCERPPRSRTAEQRDELPSFHSISSSARTSKDNGISIPSAFGALQVDEQLDLGWLLDREICRLAPLRIRST